ncbi:hypothetical protein JOF53_006516 [Crossiella equi]|uniref:Resolvase/invertase-type recombinase catalytic domain-containing protein n=1 Tax=Crossiella equi TaxID=130796 RepID=A0ABS5AM56_9PSEU|nr:recombinase family protein [Crossiella equi]MBP2477644.1 hypothetical protein [Crossiella equi]
MTIIAESALERAGVGELANCARPGDRITVSEVYRLCRDLADILAVRDWCGAREVKLRVLSGSWSGIVDLTAAWRAGSTSGRRPRLAELGVVEQVRADFRAGASITALARKHRVSRGAVRTCWPSTAWARTSGWYWSKGAIALPDKPARPARCRSRGPARLPPRARAGARSWWVCPVPVSSLWANFVGATGHTGRHARPSQFRHRLGGLAGHPTG